MRLTPKRVLAGQTVLFVLYFLMAIPTPAYAHPDYRIANDTLTVAPGGFVDFPLTVHFHRVVGSFEVINPAGGTVRVLVMNDQAFTKYAAGQPAAQFYFSDKAGNGRLNFLIRCCFSFKDFFTQDYTEEGVPSGAYSKFRLVIANSDPNASTTVRLKVDLIHDGLAILVLGGEPFGTVIGGAVFGGIGLLMAVFLRRNARAATASPAGSTAGGKIAFFSLAALVVFGIASALGLGLALNGSRSFGGTLIDGLAVRNAVDFPAPRGAPFFVWMLTLILWLAGFRLAAAGGSRLLGGVGLIQGAGPFLLGSLLALNYGSVLAPAFFASVVGLPQVLGSLYLIQRSRRKMGYQQVSPLSDSSA